MCVCGSLKLSQRADQHVEKDLHMHSCMAAYAVCLCVCARAYICVDGCTDGAMDELVTGRTNRRVQVGGSVGRKVGRCTKSVDTDSI